MRLDVYNLWHDIYYADECKLYKFNWSTVFKYIVQMKNKEIKLFWLISPCQRYCKTGEEKKKIFME